MVPLPNRFVVGLVALVATLARLSAQAPPQDHPGQYREVDVAVGARVYSTQCAQCHGPNGDAVAGVDLRRGPLRRAATDEALARVITAGIPGTGMPPFVLQPAELVGIVAFVRAGFDETSDPVGAGDPGRGRALLEGKGACLTCHRVNGIGSRVAPDLSDVGAARTPAALQQSLIDPSAAMMPINRPIRIVMRDGSTLAGRRLNEDTYSVQLIDEDERLRSVPKSEMRSYVVETTSTMPSYGNRLTAGEIADLVSYLGSLKGS